MMKTKLQFLFTLLFGILSVAQSFKPIAREISDYKMRKIGFEKFTLFTKENSTQKQAKYQQAASDVSVLKLNKSQLLQVTSQKPQAMEMTYPFENGEMTVELVRVDIFSNEFHVETDKGKINNYSPGVYYRGIIKNDMNSVVSFSFFYNDVVGIASVKDGGNIVLGKAIDSEDFVVYDDLKLKDKNGFLCVTDELMQNQREKISFDPKAKAPLETSNCVRIYYEMSNSLFILNGSNLAKTINWMTAVHNNVNTLYANDGVKISLKTIYVWTTEDPYKGNENENLEAFSLNRPVYDGDLAHLVNIPSGSVSGVAFFNSLCTTYNHAYSAVRSNYSNVPTYSWTVSVLTHEMGHSLGSLHTHACAWNGNNTAIDGCGAQAGYGEGCDGPIPTKGSMMSYCHLLFGVGISFANGFGPQPAAVIRANIDTKACLGTDCITTCPITISKVNFNHINKTGFTANITDEISTSWKYRVIMMDGTIAKSGTTSTKNFSLDGLEPGKYYKLLVGTSSCALENAFQTADLFLTDDDWCGEKFTDSGGLNDSYSNVEKFVKTFYPDSNGQKLKLTFSNFNLDDYDVMTIRNGASETSPIFLGANNLTGSLNPGSFTSSDTTGAITVVFTSDSYITKSGWEADFSCAGLDVSDIRKESISIYPNPVENHFKINGFDNIESVKVFDSSGKLIKTFDFDSLSKNSFDVSKLKIGSYLVVIKTQEETVSIKLIKQ